MTVDILRLLILIIVLVAGVGIVFWFVRKVNIPEPFSYVLYAVVAILGLLVLGSLVGVGPVVIR